jgi:hypothetical protein
MISAARGDGYRNVNSTKNSVQNAADLSAGGPLFLTANNSLDSHAIEFKGGKKNRSREAGRPYRGISWDGIRRLAQSPANRAKSDMQFVILSTYIGCDGRTHQVQRERGWFGGLAIDIDKGNLSLEAVVNAVVAVVGVAWALIYSSSSATPEDRKWRVLIRLASLLPGADYHDTQTALFSLLAERGVLCDATLARAGQPIYLPNVPRKRRGPDGRPVFYQWREIGDEPLEIQPGCRIVDRREALRAEQEAKKTAAAERAEQYRIERLAYVQATGDGFEPIAHFKEHHSVADMLRRYGFKQNQTGDWKSPLSESGSYSTKDNGDHWVTFSAWAHNHNVGRVSSGGYHYGDAFDLYAHFEHHGDKGAAVRAYAEAVRPAKPAPPPAEIERMPDRGPERNLDEWRRESLERRIAALRKPGIYLDRGEVGTGKTTTTIRAISDTGEPPLLWLMPDHANCKEREVELRKKGIPAVAYPRLDEGTCQNLDEVRQAQAIGLIAGAAVCPTCPLKTACEQNGYLALKDKADKSEYRVATISRAAASDAIFRSKAFRKDGIVEEGKPKTWTRGAPDVIVIDERVGDVLAETVTTGLEDLDAAAFILGNVTTDAPLLHKRYQPTTEHVVYAAKLVAVIEAIRRAAENVADGGVHRVELPPGVKPPKRWQVTFKAWVQGYRSLWERSDAWPERFAGAVRLITLAATGGLAEVWVAGERRHRFGKVQIEAIGKRLADLPATSKVFLLDADATAADLTARSGRQIEDITPAGHLPVVQKVRQVPLDVTKNSKPAKTARIIEAHLHANPAVRRLGVIGHKGAIEAVLGEDDGYLQPWDRERVAMYAGFNTGRDRGSNTWPLVCDDLVVIGTPRPPTIRQWLIAHGEIEAAALEDGEWGDLAWEGVTIDGRWKVFRCRGPRHPAWRRAARAIHLAAIRQAAGRARAILPGAAGISVTVYSDQPTGFPVDESIEAALPAVHEAVEAVAYLAQRQAESAQTPREYLGRCALSMNAVGILMLTGNGGKGVKKRWAQRQIDLAVKAGRLERLPGRLLRIVEAAPAALPAVKAPETCPPPAGPPARPAAALAADPPPLIAGALPATASTTACAPRAAPRPSDAVAAPTRPISTLSPVCFSAPEAERWPILTTTKTA